MDTPDANSADLDAANPTAQDPNAPFIPTLQVEVATVSVVDSMWQDQPDNVAAFVEARLGELARGRGNLYICLDVSGELEGRGELERALIEVLRDTYAAGRGSISFGLSEALRAANAYLYESNRQVARELRRMAGVSVVVLRGNDLYVAQAGPAVVYVEASEKLARYPAESDWFVEDAPLIAPQGTASAPLGIRREFASDLAHASITVGDVFVLATRSLTTLATTEELAIAFTERRAQDIASYLEELGEDADMTALVAELMDPNVLLAPQDEGGHLFGDAPDGEPHIESLPVPLTALVPLDESEPPLEQDQEPQAEAQRVWEAASQDNNGAEPDEFTLEWDETKDEEAEEDEEPQTTGQDEIEEPQDEPQPIYASVAAATFPLSSPPAFAQQPAPDYAAELARRRVERAAQRERQKEGIARALGGVTATLLAMTAAVGNLFRGLFGAVDWDGLGNSTNRGLNLAVSALISFFLLLVRLVLPGATTASTRILPRRATSEPIWIKFLAIALPLLFVGLAGARYVQTLNSRETQFNALVAQADTIVKQAEINPDKGEARKQLNRALDIIRDARTLRDTQTARAVLYRIQDQLNEMDGVAVLYFLPSVADLRGAHLKQIAASDQDIFLLDGNGAVRHFVVNNVSGEGKPASGDGTLLKAGDKVGTETVGSVLLLTAATPSQDKGTIVAVTNRAFFIYDPESGQWSASPIQDGEGWGEVRTVDTFGGNVYLLDAKNNQIYKYGATATGFTPQGAPYFPADAQPRLNKAVDLAIDGDVWVLNDNGTVQRYRAGKAIPFTLGALPAPLKNPVAIFTRSEVDALYIADAGNERIVEFDKNGVFVRQFKPYAEMGDVFKNLQDFTVNETKRKLYFVNPDGAYMANVPK